MGRYLETTSKIAKELNTLTDEDNLGQNEDIKRDNFTIDRTDHKKVTFKIGYVKKINRPFGRLQSRRAKKYGKPKPALTRIDEQQNEDEVDSSFAREDKQAREYLQEENKVPES